MNCSVSFVLGVVIFSERKQLYYAVKKPKLANLVASDSDLSSSIEVQDSSVTSSSGSFGSSASTGIADIFAKLNPAHCTPEWREKAHKEFGKVFVGRHVSKLVNNRDGKGTLNFTIENCRKSTLKRGRKFDRDQTRKTIIAKYAATARERASKIFQAEFKRLITCVCAKDVCGLLDK